jgi:hypothetical protein
MVKNRRLLFCLSWPVSLFKKLPYNRNYKDFAFTSITKWLVLVVIILFSAPSFAQDKKPVNNKGKIKQMNAKSVKKKEKASTKDIAGKRLRTKNANSVANRAVHSNPSPYANERRGKDRVAKPIDGQPLRIRSRSGEAARNNVYPQRGPFVNQSSKKTETSQSNRFTRSNTRSRSTSAESSRSNAYPQKGPFVSRSPKQTERPAARTQTRTGRLSTNTRSTRSVRASAPRSSSSSAEYTKGKRFQQSGAYVNRSSKSTERVSAGTNQYGRRTKLSAGPRSIPPGKNRSSTPRTASRQFVTKGKKDVYWGKFSKGEKAITTDVSGNPLRRRNYRTPPNEIIKPKDPYAGRKRSSGDRAYSGTFRSGHESASKRSEKAWAGDLSGQPVRKRPARQTEVVGKRTTGPARAGGSISGSGDYRSNKPFRGRPGSLSISGSGKGKSSEFKPRGGGSISASGQYRSNQPYKGSAGSISGSPKYRSNKPYNNGGGGSISASGKYRSNKQFNRRVGAQSVSSKNRTYEFKPKGGGSISASGEYRSNQPYKGSAGSISGSPKYRSNKPYNNGGGGSISASGDYRSSRPFKNRMGPQSVSGKNRVYDFKPKGGGSISASGKYRSNQPIGDGGGGSISATGVYRSNQPYNKGGGGSISANGEYRSNKAFKNRIGPLSVSGENRTYEFKPKGGGSVSGKLWNNDERPIEVRTPKGAYAAEVGYSGKTKLPFFKKSYVKNPNASELALKKESPKKTVYMADKMQVLVKAKETGTKPKAVKGSMPGLAPSKATVKASEYSNSMKVYWNYKHNPSSADESQKTIAPGRAHARVTEYQGNVKMKKYNDKRFLPDSRFAHGPENNVKQERTIKTDFKLLWAKIFKKNGTQPDAVKEKTVRPRYDKRERELWPGLYD